MIINQANFWFGTLVRLRQVAPNSPVAAQAAATVRVMTAEDPAVLAEARRLAQAGRSEEAVQMYRALFGGNAVPDRFAVEYYLALGSTSLNGFREARRALDALVARSPGNTDLAIAAARLATYRETTRTIGIERLEVLAQDPQAAEAARAAWRQALLWLGPNGEAVDLMQRYLRVYPDDHEIADRMAASRSVGQDASYEIRQRGYDALQQHKTEEAATAFEAALATRPDDVDALIGLGIARRRQGRIADARELMAQAVALAPERADEFSRTLGFTGGGGAPTPVAATRNVAARRALQRGQLESATALAERALDGPITPDQRAEAATILGQVALRRQDYLAAEARFREALAQRPRAAEAQGGLYEALLRQGRFKDADLMAQSSGYRPGAAGAATRAALLRAQAAQAGRPEAAIPLLREALLVDPGNAWVSYDLALALRKLDRRQEARAIEAGLSADGGPPALEAAALLAAAEDRTGDVVATLQRIPPAALSPDNARLLARSRIALEVARMEDEARHDSGGAAGRRLLQLAARPDASGLTGAAVVRAFGRLGDEAAASAAARSALRPGALPAAKAEVAAALLDAGRLADAQALMTGLGTDPRLDAATRDRLEGLRAGMAIARSDRLAERGEEVAALGQLTPALRARPEDPALLLALGRLYLSDGRAAAAQEIAETVLAREPGNLQARLAAADAAIALRDWSRAEFLLVEGRALRFDPLQMALLEARLTRSRGQMGRAERALESARDQRLLQLRPVDQR